jgi:Methylamine utilisation protein MauE
MGETSLVGAVQSLTAQMAAFQAFLLAAAAVHKAARWTHSLTVVQQFAGVPGTLAASSLGAATAAELAAGALLLVPAYRATGAVLAALLWTLYVALIIRAVVQGRRDVDCGCGFGPTSRPLGRFQIVRNVMLAALAVCIAWVSAFHGAAAIQGTFVVGGLGLLALYGALDQVMALRPLRSGELI